MKKVLIIIGFWLACATSQEMVKIGEEFLNLGNWMVALDYFEQALEENPRSAPAWYGKGVALCQLGKFEPGLSAMDEALRLSPNNYNYLYGKGVCYEWRGKDFWAQAESYYQRAMELAPEHPQLYHKLASLYQQQNRYEEAIPLYKKAIELNPGYYISYNNLASCYLALNQPKPAVELYRQAIIHSAYSSQFHFYHHLGIALLADGKPEPAKASFLIETAQNPDFADAHLNLGNLYLLEKNYLRALEEYQEVISIDPQIPEAYFNLGHLYLLLKQYEPACKNLEKYIELQPDCGKGHYFLSLCYHQLGDKNKAFSEFNQSLKLGYHPEPIRQQLKGEK